MPPHFDSRSVPHPDPRRRKGWVSIALLVVFMLVAAGIAQWVRSRGGSGPNPGGAGEGEAPATSLAAASPGDTLRIQLSRPVAEESAARIRCKVEKPQRVVVHNMEVDPRLVVGDTFTYQNTQELGLVADAEVIPRDRVMFECHAAGWDGKVLYAYPVGPASIWRAGPDSVLDAGTPSKVTVTPDLPAVWWLAPFLPVLATVGLLWFFGKRLRALPMGGAAPAPTLPGLPDGPELWAQPSQDRLLITGTDGDRQPGSGEGGGTPEVDRSQEAPGQGDDPSKSAEEQAEASSPPGSDVDTEVKTALEQLIDPISGAIAEQLVPRLVAILRSEGMALGEDGASRASTGHAAHFGCDAADSGGDVAVSGRLAADSGGDIADSGRLAADFGGTVTDSGRLATDSSGDVADSGSDAADSARHGQVPPERGESLQVVGAVAEMHPTQSDPAADRALQEFNRVMRELVSAVNKEQQPGPRAQQQWRWASALGALILRLEVLYRRERLQENLPQLIVQLRETHGRCLLAANALSRSSWPVVVTVHGDMEPSGWFDRLATQMKEDVSRFRTGEWPSQRVRDILKLHRNVIEEISALRVAGAQDWAAGLEGEGGGIVRLDAVRDSGFNAEKYFAHGSDPFGAVDVQLLPGYELEGVVLLPAVVQTKG